MTLDLLQVAPHIDAMAREAGTRRRTVARCRLAAAALMQAWNGRLDALRALAQRERAVLVAEPLEPLLSAHPTPPVPPDFVVVAADGSSIDLDRHGMAQCYLINTGAAVIRYGARPAAELSSRATLYFRDEDLYVEAGGARLPVQTALVDLKRTLAELSRVLELARGTTGVPAITIADGTLLLWQLEGRAEVQAYVAGAIGSYAAGLEQFRTLGVPVCGFVSRPGSRDVAHLLRAAAAQDADDDGPWRDDMAPDEAGRPRRSADVFEPLTDRALMGHLRPGERSARFASRSPVLRHYGERSAIHFFYLNVGSEIARIDVPAWVSDDPATLDLVHAAVYDGCARGWGYPPALSEAHEQAVIRGSDREAFLRLVTEALNDAGQPAELSLKQLSKNRRAV